MDYNKKTFWRYIISEHLHPRNWIKNSVFYEYLLMFLILYSVIFTELTLQRKAVLFLCFLIAISIIKVYSLYKSGYHRHWNRLEHGILSKSDIKKLKRKKEKEKQKQEERKQKENRLPQKQTLTEIVPKKIDEIKLPEKIDNHEDKLQEDKK